MLKNLPVASVETEPRPALSFRAEYTQSMGVWYDGYRYDVETEEEAEQFQDKRGVTIATDRSEIEAGIADGEYSPPDQRLLGEPPTDEDSEE